MSTKINNTIEDVPTEEIRQAMYKMKDFLDDQLLDLTLFEDGKITLKEFRDRGKEKALELEQHLECMDVLDGDDE